MRSALPAWSTPASRKPATPCNAKNGKFLAIPLPAALDERGVPLQSSPRDWPNTFCARDDESPGVMAEQALTVVKRAMTVDRTWGGLAIDTKVTNSEIDLVTYADRSDDGGVRLHDPVPLRLRRPARPVSAT